LEAIEAIESYVQGLTLSEFRDKSMIQDAVIRRLEIIGEATKHLSETMRSQQSGVPWRKMAGMRDRLIHGYFAVEVDEVWLTVQRDLPELKESLRNILEQG
jgi:uncharacterized protein with HEPN domain